MQTSEKLTAALEAHLEEHLNDPVVLEELERLAARHGADPTRIRTLQLQCLVRSLGFSDRDAAMASLRQRIAMPNHAAILHIQIAQIYAMENRLDEARAELDRGTDWLRIQSARFRLHMIPGSTAHLQSQEIVRSMEEGLTALEQLFAHRYGPRRPIVYYLYESTLHKRMATGDPMPAHAFTGRGEVHAVYGPDLKIDPLHENSHILLRSLGRPPKLLEEGAAEYGRHREGVHAAFAQVRQECSGLNPAQLLDDRAFAEISPWFSYPLAGSFAAFLIRTGGVERFKELYGRIRTNPGRVAIESYGRPLESLATQWRTHVGIPGRNAPAEE